MTGILLAIARIAGETAPLLFTSLGNLNWSIGLGSPMASLPVTIYQYAGSAFEDWVQLAWVGALLITVGVLALNIAARFALRGRRSPKPSQSIFPRSKTTEHWTPKILNWFFRAQGFP